MSEPSAPPEQEEDNPNVLGAVVAAAVVLLVFAVGIGWVVFMLRARGLSPRTLGGRVPVVTGQAEIGVVDQRPFESDGRLARELAAQRRILETYGWIDADAGIGHIPVQVAVDILLDAGHR